MADIPWDDLMDAAGGSDYAPIPQGDYDVKIIETEATKSSTDKPMWKITVQVTNGPHEGRKVWTQQTLTMDNPDALNVFFRQMAAAGLTGEFFKTKPSNERIAEALLGRSFRAKVTIREWQGVPRNNIKQWNPIGAGGGAPGGPPQGGGMAGGPPSGPPPPPSAGATAPPPPPAPPAPPAPPSDPAAPPSPPSSTTNGTPAPAPTPEPEPAAATAGPASGGGDPWVVEERKTGSAEPPPF
jgi:hypothetical protein